MNFRKILKLGSQEYTNTLHDIFRHHDAITVQNKKTYYTETTNL